MLAALAIVACLPLPASALELTGTIVATGAGGNIRMRILDSTTNTSWVTHWGGQIIIDRVGGDFTDQLLPDIGNQVISYCLEPEESIGYSTYTWQASPLENGSTQTGGIGITKARHIQDLLYHIPDTFQAAATGTQALALQIALWEIARETDTGGYSLSGGNVAFQSASGTPAGALNTAQQWLDQYVNDGTGGPYDDKLIALTRIGNQDLIVRRVPAPATLLLFAPLLWLARRRPLTTARA